MGYPRTARLLFSHCFHKRLEYILFNLFVSSTCCDPELLTEIGNSHYWIKSWIIFCGKLASSTDVGHSPDHGPPSHTCLSQSDGKCAKNIATNTKVPVLRSYSVIKVRANLGHHHNITSAQPPCWQEPRIGSRDLETRDRDLHHSYKKELDCHDCQRVADGTANFLSPATSKSHHKQSHIVVDVRRGFWHWPCLIRKRQGGRS
jgi:hypothetical protein